MTHVCTLSITALTELGRRTVNEQDLNRRLRALVYLAYRRNRWQFK
jgi:hypothetical protein